MFIIAQREYNNKNYYTINAVICCNIEATGMRKHLRYLTQY